jgi:DNA-binding SARP family transcriptional activator/predicted ATPase
MARLSISLLGHLQVRLDGELVTAFESNKVRALLVYLAVEANYPHSREKMAGLLWPDFPERSALGNVRYALSNLRKTIGDRDAQPPFLLITHDALQFNRDSNCDIDTQDFVESIGSSTIERLEHAVTLYRGEFLDGFAIDDSATFEEWVVVKREQMQRKILMALRRLADHHEGVGEYEQAQQYAWRLVELEPWQEEGHQQLMRMLALNGQRSAALAQYETCRRLLADELGVEPSAETTSLYQNIRDEKIGVQPTRVTLPAFLDSKSPSIEIEQPVFVARQIELARLDQILNQSFAKHGQVVFVTGEPGSGKTMLIQEFIRHSLVAYPDLIVVSGNCNAYTGFGDPYLPFLEILQMLTGDVEAKWAGGAISRIHAQRLWALLPNGVQALIDVGQELIDRFVAGNALLARAQSGAPQQVKQINELLKRRAASSGGASIQQSDLFEQFFKVLQALSHKDPLLLVVDDLQWADEGSINLLFHLGRLLVGHRILLVGAYRPGDVAMGRASERHPLEPIVNELQRQYGDVQVDLARVEGRHFVDAFIESEPNQLGLGFRQALYQHTSGLPLFVVELFRGLQERGDLIKDESGRWIVGKTLDWEILPPRVEAVIAESIGRLPETWQTTLTIASAEGEVFTAQAVSRIQAMDDREVIQQLSGPLSKLHQLVTAVGVQRWDEQQVSNYRFRHFLFQKYLYNRLDEVERVHLHELIGNALEMLYGERSPQIALQLARHFEVSGQNLRAVKYLHVAGDQAVRLYANTEAITHYQHALDLLQLLPDSPDRIDLELRLRTALGVPLLAMRGFGDSDLEQNYNRARELTRHVALTSELFQVLSGLKSYYDLRLSLNIALDLARDMVKLSERLKDQMLQQFAYHQMSTTILYQGQLNSFLEYRRRAHELYDQELFRTIIFQLGFDPESAGLSHAGWAYWLLGFPEQAKRNSQDALTWAKELGHPFMIAFASFFAAQLHCYLRDVAMTRTLAEETITLSRNLGMAFWLAAGESLQGWVLAKEGKIAEAIPRQEQALSTLGMIGAELGRIQHVPLVVEMYSRVGKVEEGLTLVQEALEKVTIVGYRMVEPDLLRCKGALLLHNDNTQAEAEDCLLQSIESAQSIEAKSWELRAALSLSRLWQQQGKTGPARKLLSSIYNWFTEGFDTPDLIKARQLLNELTVQ